MHKNPPEPYWQRYAKVIGIILVTLVLFLPPLMYLETYQHERAHQKEMAKMGIEADLNLTLRDHFFFTDTISQPKTVGKATFRTQEDRERFLNLTKEERYPIVIAGVLADINLAITVAFMLLMLNAVPWIWTTHKPFADWYRKRGPTGWLWLNVILIVWLISILLGVITNMTASGADMQVALLLN